MTEAKPTVFIVDDDTAVLDSTAMLVKMMQLSVETYSTAQEFLDTFDPARPGCLIIDVRMPGISGLDCLKKLWDKGVRMPSVVITGHGDDEIRSRAATYGAMAVVEKPCPAEELCDIIQQTVDALVQQGE